MNELRRRRTIAAPALCALLALLVLGVAGPVHGQTNSPGGGQPTGDAPAQGSTGNEAGTNSGGGDGQAGNRTTPGGGGATGGGSSGAGQTDTGGGGGNAGTIIGVVAILAVIGLGIAVATRHRRVMADAGAPGR